MHAEKLKSNVKTSHTEMAKGVTALSCQHTVQHNCPNLKNHGKLGILGPLSAVSHFILHLVVK